MASQRVIGVRFKKAGRIYFFDPGDDDIQSGDSVIVETVRGLECGDVVIGVREIPISDEPTCRRLQYPHRIYRKANRYDLARLKENRRLEKEAYDICQEKIREHALPMNLISVSYTFDMNKVIFYFTAESRVDFRELVRDLAYIFHTRIELRQVGVRDEAKLLGGVGCCGRALCCATFLGDFAPVSIRMAKEQNLSLNPTKISGICGRLLCCLKYESDFYHANYIEKAKNYQPKQGDHVILENGASGKVVAINEVRRNATILIDNSKDTVVTNWEVLMPLEKGETITQIAEDVIEDIETEFAPPPMRTSSPVRTPPLIRNSAPVKNSPPIRSSAPVRNSTPTRNTPAVKNSPPTKGSAPTKNPVSKYERQRNAENRNNERKKNFNRRNDSEATNLFDNKRNEKPNKKLNRQRKNSKSKGSKR